MKPTGGAVDEQQSPRVIARYIAALTDELARVARGHRMDGLACILNMARKEAEQIAERSSDSYERAA